MSFFKHFICIFFNIFNALCHFIYCSIILYINVDLANLHFTEYKKEFDSIRKYYKGVDFDNQEFEIAESVKYLKENWYNYQKIVQENAKK